jgi:curved DNA-binding protein CbpA
MPESDMAESDFVDYYELLQISPNAELETIHRVFRMLATRFHPDNTETGDLDKFLLLNKAYETLSNPELRSGYDSQFQQHDIEPIELFELKEFSLGIDAEGNRRMGILCLLYNKRRSNPDDAGMSILEFEARMSFPREHLMFTLWYLKEQAYIRQDDRSDYVITSGGVDYVEANMPKNGLVYRLLNAAEHGRRSREPKTAGEPV